MSITSRSVLNPSQLLFSLLHADFKEIECMDNKQLIRRQRQMLVQEIQYMQQQIDRKSQYQLRMEKAIQGRARLRLELQKLLRDRKILDRNAADFVVKIKMDPVQIRNIWIYEQQLQQLRTQNSKMKVKVTQLRNYCTILQNKIKLKQKQNQVVQQMQTPIDLPMAPTIVLDKYGDLDWRQKIRTYKMEEQVCSDYFRQKMELEKVRKQVALRQNIGMNRGNPGSCTKQLWRSLGGSKQRQFWKYPY